MVGYGANFICLSNSVYMIYMSVLNFIGCVAPKNRVCMYCAVLYCVYVCVSSNSYWETYVIF